MSTRSMTCFEQPYRSGALVCLYRHCDGYPAEAGANLLEALRTSTDIEGAIAHLLALRYEKQSYQQHAEPIYRAATWLPTEQGDLEHVYVASIKEGVWTVCHFARGRNESENYTTWPCSIGLLASLAKIVNIDRKAINNRIKARNVAADPYPMVEA